MKVLVTFFFVIPMLTLCSQGNIGIGTDTPDQSAILEIHSTSKGILIPRLLSNERVNMPSPANGLIVFDKELDQLYYYKSDHWEKLLIADTTNTAKPIGEAGGHLSGTYPNPTLKNNIINATHIMDNSITNADILNNSITGVKIFDGGIGLSDLAANSVNSLKIVDESIDGSDIHPETIFTGHLKDNAVTGSKVMDGTLTTDDIMNSTITTSDILDGTLSGVDIEDGSIGSSDILNFSITGTDISNNTITSSKINTSGGSVDQVLIVQSGGAASWKNIPSTTIIKDVDNDTKVEVAISQRVYPTKQIEGDKI